jgi:hypothetical protein
MTILATDHLTTNLARWNSAAANHEAAQAALAAVEESRKCSVHDEIVALAAEAHDRLFRIPAPTLGALRRKLETFWGDVFEETYGNQFRRIIIGDIVRLELLRAGVDPEEASGGMDLNKVASDFAEAAREYDHCAELRREGPSDKWGASTTSDITASLDEAESKMLSLSAPNLAAVEKKLAALWFDRRYDPIETTTAHVTILRDLRRLMITTC